MKINIRFLLVLLLTFASSQLMAQTPACETIITTSSTVITFDSDMVCPDGFVGTALTIQADDVTVDGAGFSIVAPGAGAMVIASSVNNLAILNIQMLGNPGNGLVLNGVENSTFSNINASGSGGVGYGIYHNGGSSNYFSNITVHHRSTGILIYGADSNSTYTDNNLS
ncbi:MAG: right-handed parallel beta-helix repeat-containing protein, partial [Gammaproteobacteria bacterium]|nr:right-handed parallel beta-helix repeat-containing protein [Gammaproteobacteria bacterium]